MALQMEIAQTMTDELSLIELLKQKHSLLCLPRKFSSLNTAPQQLGTCVDNRQVFFGEWFQNLVTQRITPVVGEDGFYHVWPRAGLCIDWNRTVHDDNGNMKLGRFYFEPAEDLNIDSSIAMYQIFRLIENVVRKYPSKTTGQNPAFIGPEASAMIKNGKAKLVYRGGSPIETIAN